jgi:hypothetical protein
MVSGNLREGDKGGEVDTKERGCFVAALLAMTRRGDKGGWGSVCKSGLGSCLRCGDTQLLAYFSRQDDFYFPVSGNGSHMSVFWVQEK